MFPVSQHPSSGVLKKKNRKLRLQFLVLLIMGAVTPETCRVTSQWNKADCILLHLVGLLFNLNYDARNHELKIQCASSNDVDCISFPSVYTSSTELKSFTDVQGKTMYMTTQEKEVEDTMLR